MERLFTSVILFGIGLAALLLHKNLIKKIIGLNIMDTAAYPVSGGAGIHRKAGGDPLLQTGSPAWMPTLIPSPAAGTHWNCGVCERDSADACSDGLSVSEIPFP